MQAKCPLCTHFYSNAFRTSYLEHIWWGKKMEQIIREIMYKLVLNNILAFLVTCLNREGQVQTVQTFKEWHSWKGSFGQCPKFECFFDPFTGNHQLERFRSIRIYWPELFRSIRIYWPELFRSIRIYWPEGFRSIISSLLKSEISPK